MGIEPEAKAVMRLTQANADKLLAKIDRYANTKDDNMFDAFYHSDLNVFTKLIKEATMTPEEEASLADKEESKSEQEVVSILPLNFP